MRPPPPTVFTELQWGELLQEPFSAYASFAGSYWNLSVAGPAVPCGQPLMLAVCG